MQCRKLAVLVRSDPRQDPIQGAEWRLCSSLQFSRRELVGEGAKDKPNFRWKFVAKGQQTLQLTISKASS